MINFFELIFVFDVVDMKIIQQTSSTFITGVYLGQRSSVLR